MTLKKDRCPTITPPELDQVCARLVTELVLAKNSDRINASFRRSWIVTFGQLIRTPEDQLLKKRNMGVISVKSIKDGLAPLGLCLGMDMGYIGPKEFAALQDFHIDELSRPMNSWMIRRAMANFGGIWRLHELFPRSGFEKSLRHHLVLTLDRIWGAYDVKNPFEYISEEIALTLRNNSILWE